MVHILVTARYPAKKVKEIMQIYFSGKQPKYPDFIKKIHQWVVMDNKVKTYAVYEMPDDKTYEGLLAIGKRFTAYTVIEGYRYKPEVLIEEKDAIAMMPK